MFYTSSGGCFGRGLTFQCPTCRCTELTMMELITESSTGMVQSPLTALLQTTNKKCCTGWTVERM